MGHSYGDGEVTLICLNTLPPDRKEKARKHLEETWPEILEEMSAYRREFGDCTFYYEVRREEEIE